ncbi:MAG TPA: TIR domain-containing protein [Thermoanaerobaculia bacterium]
MPTVFVSHSSEDAHFIEQQIVPLLKSRNLNVWYSAESIQTAEEWERAIRRGLEASDWFLVALSPRSAKSKWVRRETGWAFANREGRIVPILIEACDPNDLHIGLNELQFADFRRDQQKGATRLLSAFDSAPSAVAGGTPGAPEEGSAPRPDNFPLKALAHTQMLRGDFDEAIVELDGALELVPTDAGAYVLRGTCHLAKSAWDAAIGDFTNALAGDLNPIVRSLAYMYRGRANGAKNDDRMAVADCNEALRADPDNADAYVLRGKLRRRALEREGAVADFSEALKLKPTAAEAFLQRAQVFAELGEIGKAKVDYAAAVELDATFAEKVPVHLSDRAPSHLDTARIEEARRSLRAIGFLTQMDQMAPAAKARALSELMTVGFPKVMSDLDYLTTNLPKESAEYKAAVLLNDVAKKAGLKM